MVPDGVGGQPDRGPGRQAVLSWQMVSPDFFGTLGIPLVQGHDFGSQDRIDTQKVIIVDQALADKYWPAQDAIGKVIRLPGNEACTIVGVAAPIRYMNPGDPDSGPPAYFPYNQWDRAGESLLFRAKGDPFPPVPALPHIIPSPLPSVPLAGILTHNRN